VIHLIITCHQSVKVLRELLAYSLRDGAFSGDHYNVTMDVGKIARVCAKLHNVCIDFGIID
jgi:hypothetical protein